MVQSVFTKNNCLLLLVVVVFLLGGCTPVEKQPEPDTLTDLNTMVGQLGQLYQNMAVSVKGYGIVAGLPGTGSSECPRDLRDVLTKYILQQIGKDATINANSFINSKNTAVVEIYGTIPAIASKGDRFDVVVAAYSRTQTTSLAGGTLYTAELKEVSGLMRFDQFSTTLAKAQGPIFIDKMQGNTANTTGYVLGGGLVTEDVKLALGLYEPSFLTASAIRNRIDERFGSKTANAKSSNEIVFIIPKKYYKQKEKFLAMLQLLYMSEDYNLRQNRIKMLVERLVKNDNKLASEYALEAIGKGALDSISPLLKSQDETVRFHAARCMLCIGDDSAVTTLQKIAKDKSSQLRVDAIKAIGLNAKRNTATPILSRFLTDTDFKVKFATYDQLVQLDDISVSRTVVGGKIFIDEVPGKGQKIIYVSRKDVPRIVIFGSPISCEKNIFAESDDRNITLNARPGDKYVSVMRKLPNRPRLVGPLVAAYDVSDIIRTLCEDTNVKNKPQLRPGLGVSYSDIIALLEKMCKSGAIRAEFIAGDLTDATGTPNNTELNN